jgi:hypothetical protein
MVRIVWFLNVYGYLGLVELSICYVLLYSPPPPFSDLAGTA